MYMLLHYEFRSNDDYIYYVINDQKSSSFILNFDHISIAYRYIITITENVTIPNLDILCASNRHLIHFL